LVRGRSCGREDLGGSGLLAPGTLFETEYRLRLAPEADLVALSVEAEQALEGARWQDRRDGAPGVSEFVDRLGAFLVLVGLAGLAVGGVGVSAAVRAYLDEKTATIATLKTLGAEGRTIFLTYFLQIGALTLLGVALGLVLGAVAPIAFAPIIAAQLPVPAVFTVHPQPLAEAALYGVLAAALFTLWPLARTENVRAAALFRDAAVRSGGWPRPVWIGVTALVLAALVGAAAAFSGLVTLTLWSAAGIVAAFVVLVLTALGIRAGARRLARSPVHFAGEARCGWRSAQWAGRGARRRRSCCRWASGSRCWRRWGRSTRTCAARSSGTCRRWRRPTSSWTSRTTRCPPSARFWMPIRRSRRWRVRRC
jgi:putative ABC transport system permease protein